MVIARRDLRDDDQSERKHDGCTVYVIFKCMSFIYLSSHSPAGTVELFIPPHPFVPLNPMT